MDVISKIIIVVFRWALIMLVLTIVGQVYKYLKEVNILKREAKLYLALVKAMQNKEVPLDVLENLNKESTNKEIVFIAGKRLFALGLIKRMRKSNLACIEQAYRRNKESKYFEYKISQLKKEKANES